MAQPCDNLNLNLYRVFYTVAKTKSFSESSRNLHISQPAISKHIQNLEYELNTLLFYRTNRGIELTPEAKKLLVYVEKAYKCLTLGERELQEGKELTKGKLYLGIPPYISTYYLNEQIKEYMKEYPNITINISTHSDKYLLEQLEQHSLDLLITAGEQAETKELKIKKLFDIELCFAYQKDKYSVEEESIKEILNKYPTLLPTNGMKTRSALEKILKEQNLEANPIMEVESITMMAPYIKEGLGIGYIPKKIAIKEELGIIKTDIELPKIPIYLIYNEETITNSSKAFINIINASNKL